MKRSALLDDWLFQFYWFNRGVKWSFLADWYFALFHRKSDDKYLGNVLFFLTYMCHEAIVWRRKDCNSRPVKSQAFDLILTHARSNSRSHAGMWKSDASFSIPYIFLFSLIFNFHPCWSPKYCLLFAAFIIFSTPLHQFS